MHFLHSDGCKESTAKRLEDNDGTKPLYGFGATTPAPNYTLNGNQTVKAIVDMDCGQVTSNDSLNLNKCERLLIQLVTGLPATEGGLDLRSCPSVRVQVSFTAPTTKVRLQLDERPHSINSFTLCEMSPEFRLNWNSSLAQQTISCALDWVHVCLIDGICSRGP